MKERESTYKKRIEPEALFESFVKYIEYCKEEKRFPNVAGFNRFICIASSTYYDYRLLHEKEYSETINKIDLYLEDEVVNNHFTSPAERIFYLKNKFNYADKQEVKTTNINRNSDVKNMTNEELEAELRSFTSKE